MMSIAISIIIGIFSIETFTRILSFNLILSKIIWLAGGFISITICIIWNSLIKKQENRGPIAFILGIELFFIGTALIGFGLAYTIIGDEYINSGQIDGLWSIGIFIDPVLKSINNLIYYFDLGSNPMKNMIYLPLIGLSMILISYPLFIKTNLPKYWLKIIIACLVYLFTNLLDYIMTVYGIINHKSTEFNPLIQKSIDHFGLCSGVLFHKISVCGIVIAVVLIYSFIYEYEESKNLIPECFLYCGSILTLIAVALWLRLI